MPTNAEHEAAVEAFMAAARLADPERHALVCAKHPVKTRHQLDHIRRVEIPVGLHPGKFAVDEDRALVAPSLAYLETA